MPFELNWPGYSPDLSPNKNVWSRFKDEIAQDCLKTVNSLKKSKKTLESYRWTFSSKLYRFFAMNDYKRAIWGTIVSITEASLLALKSSSRIWIEKAPRVDLAPQQWTFILWRPDPSLFRGSSVHSFLGLASSLQKLHSSVNMMKPQSLNLLFISFANWKFLGHIFICQLGLSSRSLEANLIIS